MFTNLWVRIGWRNIGRNHKRTTITAIGLGISYFAVVFITGWAKGITAEMVENATSLANGQIEIHAANYLPEQSLYETIGGRDGVNIEYLLQQVRSDRAVSSVAPRVYAGGLISSDDSTAAVMLMGIDTNLELKISRFLDTLSNGRLPTPDQNELVIGDEMAHRLAVDVGNEVVVVAPGADGSMGNDLFTITGTFHTGLREFDALFGVLPYRSLQNLVVLDPGRIHEVAVTTPTPWLADDTSTRLTATLAPEDLDVTVLSWTELRPEMLDYVLLVDSFYLFIFAIVFFIAAFGIANTMLLATFERRREFAIMLALGTTPTKIVLAVLSEALTIGFLALAIGAVVTFPLMLWWHNAPPDLSWLYGDLTAFGTLIRPKLRVEYNVMIWIQSALALLITTVVAALYPAIRASRIPPADTLSGL